MMRLQDKVAIITGAGGGIGGMMARMFAAEGAAVVVGEINEESGSKVVEDIQAAGGQAILALCDVSQPIQVKHMFDDAEGTFGKVDVLVNNAMSSGESILANDWEVVEVGFRGTYLCTEAAIEKMKKIGGGSIVSISSVNALGGFGPVPIYGGVKAGVIGMMRTYAISQGKHQIRFNCICPGTVVTEIWNDLIEREPGILERISSFYPMGKLGKPEDIAQAAIYLASDESQYTNGGVMVVDGGVTAGVNHFLDE